jgi:dienelactone hydrolase
LTPCNLEEDIRRYRGFPEQDGGSSPDSQWLKFALLVALVFLCGCSTPQAPATTPAATLSTRPVAVGTLVVLPTLEPPASIYDPVTTPAAGPATPSPTLTPEATPHPLAGVTIDGLSARSYPGGPLEILQTLETTALYTRYAIAYPSDGLTITGIMQVPQGTGPFPVIILNHGYYDRAGYRSGTGTSAAAEAFNQHGYLTIAPDYRSWGQSDWGPSLFQTGLVADVVNLLSSLKTIPRADPQRVGMWGHSMGGGITTKVLTIDSRVRAAVLYAPNSGDDADLIARWGPGCLVGEAQATDKCNPGEVIPAGLPPEIVLAYRATPADPSLMALIAPIYHLDRVTAPVQIHIGAADGTELSYTPPEWSHRLHEAFLAAGKSSELFIYDDQGHFLTGDAWAEMIRRSVEFFDLHLR